MEKGTRSYQSKIALRNYGIVFVLMVLCFIALVGSDASAEMILLKMPLAPLGFLAWKGVFSLYAQPIYEDRFTLRAFECSVLQAIVSALLIGIFIWEPDKSASALAKEYGSVFGWFLGLHMILLIIQVYANSKKPESWE